MVSLCRRKTILPLETDEILMHDTLGNAPKKESPDTVYRNHFDRYTALLVKAQRVKDRISNGRLVAVVLALVCAVLGYRMHQQMLMAASLLGGAGVFGGLVIWHAALFRKVDDLTSLTAINRSGIDRCSGRWNSFVEQGSVFVDNDHPYTSDLDIFGTGSLYQYISCAHTYYGKRCLARLLDGTASGSSDEIAARQEAVDELAGRFSWRQQYECCGYASDVGNDPEKLIAWGATGPANDKRALWYAAASLLSLLTISSAIGGYLLHASMTPAVALIALQVVLTVLFARRNLRLFNIFEKNARALSVYGKLMHHIASQQWDAALLKKNQTLLAGGRGASVALRRLASIVAASEVRLSPLPWLVANAFLLWDIRCAGKLVAWKKEHGRNIRSWFVAAGEFEALASLSFLRYENPDWIFPELKSGVMTVEAKGMGHPLISDVSRVVNDLTLGPAPGSVGIITGSNMSGKSTFLRTVGCNLVCAYAGAPVCARTFICGIFSLFTSMRTGDNLLSHTSTFYAELLRVKKIVDAVKLKRPLVYLLDELFRGTNSADRHDGAVALIDKLSLPHTLGLVATHDLELCHLASTHTNIANYHFQEQYENGEIRFDYLLREGPSTTRNALYLMRMVGIEVPEDESLRPGEH
jgi:hypothetical protein